MRNLMLIFNNIKQRQGQAVITVSIIAITICIFTLVFGTIQVMRDGLRLSKEKLGADLVLIPRYASVESRELLFTASPENVYMPNSVLDEVNIIEGIAHFTPQFFAQTLVLSCCQPGEAVRIIGFDPESDFILKHHLKFKDEGIGNDDVILGSNFDEDLIGNPYLILGREFYPKNQLSPTGSGIDNTIFMTLDTVRKISKDSVFKDTLWKKKDPADYISAILVKLKDGVDPLDIQEYVNEEIKDAKVVLTGETIFNMQQQIKTVMLIVIILWVGCLAISILSLFARFNAIVNSRKKEIGLLRALGVKKNSVFIQIIGECSIVALIGGFFGSLLATLFMGEVVNILKDIFLMSPSVWNLKIAIISILVGCFLSLSIGIISSFYPARKSANLDPQEAIIQGSL
ncbi:MAG: ABC transporter permease [Treponema sp.]